MVKIESMEAVLSEECYYRTIPEREMKALIFFLEGESRVDACLKAGLISEKISQASRIKASRIFKSYRIKEFIKNITIEYSQRIGEIWEYEVEIVEKLQSMINSENLNPKIQLGAIRELRECLETLSIFKNDKF